MAAAGSKKDKREQDEIEQLLKENRELKSLNRSLTKQLKKLAKGIHRQEALEILESIEDVPKKEESNRPICPECSRGAIKEVNLAGRRFQSCTICEWKSGRLR